MDSSSDAGTRRASPWRIRECTGDDVDALVATIRSAFGQVARRLGLVAMVFFPALVLWLPQVLGFM